MKQTRRHNRLLLVLALLGITSLLLVRGTLPSVTAAGSGDFRPHPTTPSFGAGDSTDVALGDIDGDGDRDAVIGNLGGEAATVWVNNGTGVFSAHPTTPSFGAGNSAALALGDIDGDGDLDAVLPGTVWVNNGTGSFSAHPTTPSFGAGNSSDVALGDIDGDGDLDAVVANYAQAATVWVNNGTGSFSAHPTTPSFGGADSSRAVALGDIDGDGDLDAVVANSLSPLAETVWVNNGTGSFSAHPTTPSFGGGTSNAVALGDIDGDGDLDAVVANSPTEPETVWVNNGTGSFSAHPTTPSFGAGNSSDVALGDIDGDGDLDAVVANFAEGNTVWVNNGAGSFTPHPTTPSFGAGTNSALALGDIDGDSDLDAVVANLRSPFFSSPAETVWVNGTPDTDGDGISDDSDNCPGVANADQADADNDGLGDVCDPDDDNDGVSDTSDNCQFTPNTNQANNDNDAQGDVCDPDDDNDGVADISDNCQFTANPGQADADNDGIGDVCDPDDDNDGVADTSDLCPGTPAGTTVNASGCPLGVNKDQCKGNGWQTLRRANNTPFKNQGDCIQYVNTGK